MAQEYRLKKKLIFLLVGPSCSGKTYLHGHLMENYPDVFSSLVSYTTRDKRVGEEEGVDYEFVSSEEANRLIESGESLQHVNYRGVIYGTKRGEVQQIWADDKVPLTVVEPTGVYQFKEAMKDTDCIVFSIYVTASKNVTMMRWLARFYAERQSNENFGLEDMEYMADRMVNTFENEYLWYHKHAFNFYVDSKPGSSIKETSYALSRIASGKISQDMIGRISPKPVD
jgi:guanylate kinase